MFECLENLLLSTLSTGNEDQQLIKVGKIFKDDIDMERLPCHLEFFKAMLNGHEIECFSKIQEVVKDFKKAQFQALEDVIKIIYLILVNPTTNATGERSFSMIRRIKMWVRSRMKLERFNGLSILHEHKDRCCNLNLIDLTNAIVSNEKRHCHFGFFTEGDL